MDTKSNTLYYDYTVKPGDTLSGIVHTMYGHLPSDLQYMKSLEFLLSLNPQIKNPDRVFPGDQIHLGVIPQAFRSPVEISALSHNNEATSPIPKRPGNATTQKVPQHDADYYWALAWLEHNSNYLVAPGSVAARATSNLLSPGNTTLISKVSDLYAQYKSGKMTKGEYDYRRKVALDQLKKNVGPMEKLLLGNKTTHESIRIARGGGVPATAHIDKNFHRLSRIASLGKYGGIALAGVGVTASCMQIANTRDRHEKNEIFVETLASTVVGTGTGVALGAFLISNPIGWGTALVLAVGTTALSYYSGKFGRYIYDRNGRKVDIVTGMGIDKLCR
ncbi:MAG: LysM peptidoglycan-binding domain-containing protein [Candidatus Polarisedimenticolaceae bacterium]|nr:LysM peptidoglycan-binding domain-containing protein [Candidatus Polarisedimenticolaceae bacterium]